MTTTRTLIPTRTGFVLAVAQFEADFGSVVRNALQLHASHMHEAAAECDPTAKPGPAAKPEPAVPVTGMTINITPDAVGLRRRAGALTESADRAIKALAALDDIFELAEALAERI